MNVWNTCEPKKFDIWVILRRFKQKFKNSSEEDSVGCETFKTRCCKSIQESTKVFDGAKGSFLEVFLDVKSQGLKTELNWDMSEQ